jgi:DNA-binding FadR family transcriptional regulator
MGASASTYRPVDARRLHESVVQQLTKQIVSGALEPGATLPTEPELVQHFGVSRPVIREAVRVLVSKGLVVVKQGSGTRVQPPDEWCHLDPSILFERVRTDRNERLLDELLDVRRAVEVEAAALAAVRRTPDDLEALRAAIEGMRAVLGDPDAYTHLDIAFHERIFLAAGNQLLRQALRPISQALNVGRFISVRQPGAAEQSMRGHDEVFAAIEQADAEAARAAMRRHITQFEADIRAGLRRRFVAGPSDLTLLAPEVATGLS